MASDDPSCSRCNGRMVETSVWKADEPGRAWQQVRRYRCTDCNVEGVLTVGRDRPNVVGGFLETDPTADPATDCPDAGQTTLATDGGGFDR